MQPGSSTKSPAAPDLRNLRPAELVRILNSTALGPVITERVMMLHRNEAGMRIGTGRRVDFIKYLAWLTNKWHTIPLPESPLTAYERNKERARLAAAEASLSGRDIGPPPPVVNLGRKTECGGSFELFCRTYFPETFRLAWSEDHLKVIGQIEAAVMRGDLFATAMPRGSGKTTMAEVACVWAVLYGHRSFVVLIGSDEGHATQMLDSVKTELESNDILAEDFPEVCHPIRRLEGIAHRCNGQLCQGRRTNIGWTADEIVMPAMPDSLASEAIIKVTGITGGLRGMKYKRRDGQTVRPDLTIIDDPQTDSSAYSMAQCETRERILAGAILGLAGPGKKIAGIMPCTVIRTGDMADRILNRDLHPEWQGTRTKMVYSFPTNGKLWEEYAQIRAGSLKAERGGVEATEFYRANREAMDVGSRVAWSDRHNPDEISALQHAMNLKLRDERAFAAEYQNEPLPEDPNETTDLTADEIAGKLSRIARGIVPLACTRLTAFIDVQGAALYYVVCAWEDNFSGSVIDYGTFPEQDIPYFTLRDVKNTLGQVITGAGLEGQIYGGLEALTEKLLSRGWDRGDGAKLKIERLPIDANWGDSTATVKKFARETPFSAIVTPSHGKYVGASSVPMAEYTRKAGDRVGLNWRVPSLKGRGETRHVIYDTNFWKSFVYLRVATAIGDRGCLTLFGSKPDAHRMFADHLKAEYRVRTQGRGREVDEWKARPERPDNHFLDCLAGATMAASMQGVILPDAGAPAEPKRAARVSFADLQRKRRP